MRLKVAGLRGVVKRDPPIEFTNEQLTSYGGLELLRRYFQRIGLHSRLRKALADSGMGSDDGTSRLAILLVTLFVVGARRLEQLATWPPTRSSSASVDWRIFRRRRRSGIG
jgi:hypothetical protein